MAWQPASLIVAKVSQSGSPTESEITLWPRAESSLALAAMARVGEGFKLRAFFDSTSDPFFSQGFGHIGRYEFAEIPTMRGDLFDHCRRHEGVFRSGENNHGFDPGV